MLELIKSRHSVRRYQNRQIQHDKKQILADYINALNCGSNNIIVCYDEPTAFEDPTLHYGRFENANNYIVLIGDKNNLVDSEILLGYLGEKLVLKCQQIGLNTCWVALTYNQNNVPVKLKNNQTIVSVITFGYGLDAGSERLSKTYSDVVDVNIKTKPEWFDDAVKACLYAPTARNKQRFKIVKTETGFEVQKSEEGEYTNIDLGILNCHFDLMQGKTNL